MYTLCHSFQGRIWGEITISENNEDMYKNILNAYERNV
jgi:hypothetical protein